ncbi:2,3-dihydro-2,3-dihydroxybenzoate dehydrogenase [Plantactinospora sp. S1510]|uniref:2,3-dihydro-2,3-dihydroxybenzoate dehydrogenase n=1 Tax=Plantactinospora alkalitolerans TaxID=2789879 RepID=A0ABS0H838_9ACTN|nr:2,3-dihydro-2,3-dihydroxybenzoate dehydrogenase [Plantactinospora alkalitolerans]MBF9134461.1 2,3-dihydro-2,3-dihydroxybenzoate dehydrogenase [Plantactinospora alkalitolerans]
MEFDGRVALVTGAAQGIGAAVAQALATRGARVAALDRNEPGVEATVARLRSARCRADACPADVSDRTAVDTVVRRIEDELGPIDILVNVAGILRTGPVLEMTDEAWSAVLDVNAGGVLRVTRAVARYMVPRHRGTIVTVGSNVSGVARMHMAAYAASKAAAAMLTKCLGLELSEAGIRCNVVSPGSTDTPMQRAMWTGGAGARQVVDGTPAMYRTGVPLGRLADPEDVAEAVVFLASERSRHITMQELYVDGGATLRV